jgi:hypothetical protein
MNTKIRNYVNELDVSTLTVGMLAIIQSGILHLSAPFAKTQILQSTRHITSHHKGRAAFEYEAFESIIRL